MHALRYATATGALEAVPALWITRASTRGHAMRRLLCRLMPLFGSQDRPRQEGLADMAIRDPKVFRHYVDLIKEKSIPQTNKS